MNGLTVGFGRADITPKKPIHLSGYGNDTLRLSEQVLDPLYVTCLAFTDGEGSTALLFAADLLFAANWMRDEVSKAIGLSAERINISASHTHSAACVRPERYDPARLDYLSDVLTPGLIQAARQALDDRKAASMYVADVQTEHMTFVRQYLMADGSYAGPGFGSFKQPIVAHEAPADDQMQLVKFRREGGKDVVVVNFQAHGTMTGGSGKTAVSADYIGAMRGKVEGELDCLFAYFNGACGDLTPTSRIEDEQRFTNDQYIQYGQTLADYAIAASAQCRPVKTGRVQVKRLPLEVEVDHSLDHLKEVAQPICAQWKATGDFAKCTAMSREAGLHSIYHAESILDKLSLGKTYDLELNALSIGDVAFAVASYEMYAVNGMQLKAASPYQMTVVATCANEYRSYLPSALAFEHGGYTVDRCRFIPGTAERMVDEFGAMLNELHSKEG